MSFDKDKTLVKGNWIKILNIPNKGIFEITSDNPQSIEVENKIHIMKDYISITAYSCDFPEGKCYYHVRLVNCNTRGLESCLNVIEKRRNKFNLFKWIHGLLK